MKFVIKRIGPELWRDLFSKNAHLFSFKEIREPRMDRIDYALLVINDNDEPVAYQTCKELDSTSVYWQFGGVFPPIIGTVNSMKVYEALRDYHKEHYDRVTTYIENENCVMLKMAMKIGFRICGIKYFNGKILLEHKLEFKHGN